MQLVQKPEPQFHTLPEHTPPPAPDTHSPPAHQAEQRHQPEPPRVPGRAASTSLPRGKVDFRLKPWSTPAPWVWESVVRRTKTPAPAPPLALQGSGWQRGQGGGRGAASGLGLCSGRQAGCVARAEGARPAYRKKVSNKWCSGTP